MLYGYCIEQPPPFQGLDNLVIYIVYYFGRSPHLYGQNILSKSKRIGSTILSFQKDKNDIMLKIVTAIPKINPVSHAYITSDVRDYCGTQISLPRIILGDTEIELCHFPTLCV